MTNKQQMADGMRQMAGQLSLMLRLLGQNPTLSAAIIELERIAQELEKPGRECALAFAELAGKREKTTWGV